MRLESIANPDGHFGFRGARQNAGTKNFGAACRAGKCFPVTQVVQYSGFVGFIGVVGVNTIDVGPNDKFLRVDDVSGDGAGKIGTVASERGDTSVGRGADEAGDYGYDSGVEQGEQDFATFFLAL